MRTRRIQLPCASSTYGTQEADTRSPYAQCGVRGSTAGAPARIALGGILSVSSSVTFAKRQTLRRTRRGDIQLNLIFFVRAPLACIIPP